MKIAVLLSNHFRSFGYIREEILNFFGPDTDYYAHTWDHNYGYRSIEEKTEIGYTPYSGDFQSHPWLYKRASVNNYTSIDISLIKEEYKRIPNISYNIESLDTFKSWLDRIDNKENFSFEELNMRYGQFYSIKRSYDLLKESGKQYDFVFRLRHDVLPHLDNRTTLQEYLKSLRTDKGYLYTDEEVAFHQGAIWINDRFWFSIQDVYERLFGDLDNKLNKLIKFYRNNHDDPDYLAKYFVFHKILGGIISISKVFSHDSLINSVIIRKDIADHKIPLNNFDTIFKYVEQHKKIDKNAKIGRPF